MKKLIYLFLLIALAFVTMGQSDCDNGPPPPPATGFRIHTQNRIDVHIGYQNYDFSVDTAGNLINDNGTAYGNTRNFREITDSTGHYTVSDGRVPARWHFAEFTGPCRNDSVNDDVTAGKEQYLICISPSPFAFFSAAPASINLQSPPAGFTITGQGIDTTYGMPLVEYYSEDGILAAQTTATAVSDDGTLLEANTPDLTSVYSGTYVIAVRNATLEGLYEFVGTTTVDTYGRDEVGCDPDGYQEQSCWNSGGDWNPFSCICTLNPCYSNYATTQSADQRTDPQMPQPVCY